MVLPLTGLDFLESFLFSSSAAFSGTTFATSSVGTFRTREGDSSSSLGVKSWSLSDELDGSRSGHYHNLILFAFFRCNGLEPSKAICSGVLFSTVVPKALYEVKLDLLAKLCFFTKKKLTETNELLLVARPSGQFIL